MPGKRLPVASDPTAETTAQRIATGLHKIGLAMKHQAWQQANEEGLSATQGQILAALVGSPETSSELARRLGVTLATVSDSVSALVDKGLVTRSAPTQGRARLLVPTARGRAVGARAKAWPEFLADAVRALDPAEQEVFLTGIVKMIRSLQEQGLVPVSGMCVTCTHFRPHVRPGPAPHHCAFVDAPLAAGDLRLDCGEHAPQPESDRARRWREFMRPR